MIAVLLSGGALNADLNLSALIYYKGFEMASYGIAHYPLGVGFLNMEFLNQFSSVSQISNFLFDLNKQDGASILFKITSEFGLLGLLLFFGLALRLLKLVRSDSDIYETAFLFAFFAAFVRGSSYFDGSLFIGISLYIYHIRNKAKSLFVGPLRI